MNLIEVTVIIDGQIENPIRHDFQLPDREPKPGEVIIGLLDAHYKTAKSIYVKNAFKYTDEVCPDCKGSGYIKACCSGDPRKIECGCHGIDQPCGCNNGWVRDYKRDRSFPYITGRSIDNP
jgi:hypothetical protein